jgi:hypothetical protein
MAGAQRQLALSAGPREIPWALDHLVNDGLDQEGAGDE